MPLSHQYQSTPIGSISLIPGQERLAYIDLFHKTPPGIHSMLSSPDTGSYIRGLCKTYNIPEDSLPKVAQAIFFIAIGKYTATETPTILSKELGLPNESVVKMFSEIEHDILDPVKMELDNFLGKDRQGITLNTANQVIIPKRTPLERGGRKSQSQNVLNLKELTTPKQQKQLPTNVNLPELLKNNPGSKTTLNSSLPQKLPLPPRPPVAPKPPVTPVKPLHFI